MYIKGNDVEIVYRKDSNNDLYRKMPYILIRKDKSSRGNDYAQQLASEQFDKFNYLSTTIRPEYLTFSEGKYNETVDMQKKRRHNRIYELVAGEAASLITLYELINTNLISNGLLDRSLISIPWLLPMPLLIATTIGSFKFTEKKDDIKLTYQLYDNIDRTVVFNIASQGNNILTLKNSIESVNFWYNYLNSNNRINYKYEIDVIIEPGPYRKNLVFYECLKEQFGETLRLIVVPEVYKTSNNTKYKARALNYAVEDRRSRGLNSDNVWVYHQDEETTVGEDTLLGISEFINKAKENVKYGAGFIIYCLDWSLRPSQIQEMSRTNDDYRVLLSLSSKSNPLVGFHGSHFLVRSKIEDEIGWNFGREAIADDLIFENALRHKYPRSFAFLKGFAFEKAASSPREQIKQRRRWALGLGDALRNKEVSKTKKIVMTYSGIAWFGSITSVGALFASLMPEFRGFYPSSLAVLGYLWTQMFNNYYDGYLFHKNYIPKDKLPKKLKTLRFVLNGIEGALIDAIAPWYALKRSGRGKGFEVLNKDATIRTDTKELLRDSK